MTEEPGGNAGTEPEAKPKTPRRKSGSKKSGGATGKAFPTLTFEEALELGAAIQEHAAGQKVRLLTLFDKNEEEVHDRGIPAPYGQRLQVRHHDH